MTATQTQTHPTLINGLDTQALQELIDGVASDPANGQTHRQVKTRWAGGTKTSSHIDHYEIAGQRVQKDWTIQTDEPIEIGGTNEAPNPQEVLLSGLNACMTVGYAAVAALMGIEIESLEIETSGDIDLRGFLGLDDSVKPGYESLQYTVRIKSSGTDEQVRQLHEAVQKSSPNYFNISQPVQLTAELVVE